MPFFFCIIGGDILENSVQLVSKFKTPPYSQTLSIPQLNLKISSKSNKTKPAHSSMADHGGNGGNEDVVDQSRDERASMEPEIEDRTAAEETVSAGANGCRRRRWQQRSGAHGS